MDRLLPEKEHCPQSGKKLGLTQLRNNDQLFNLVRTITSEIRLRIVIYSQHIMSVIKIGIFQKFYLSDVVFYTVL